MHILLKKSLADRNVSSGAYKIYPTYLSPKESELKCELTGDCWELESKPGKPGMAHSGRAVTDYKIWMLFSEDMETRG